MIEFQDVTFGYGDRPVLASVDLTLEAGGFYFLTGPSGSGKTTLLNIATLMRSPQKGEVKLFGTPTGRLDRDAVAEMRQRIGIVHQDCRFLDHLSLAENIALPLEITGRRTAAQDADIRDLLGWVGLSDHAHALPPTLSGGERQRAALARAVILSPEMLLADEPTGNVDTDMARRVLGLLVELNKLGRTVLVATHDLDLIRTAKGQVAARVLRLAEGQVHLAGAEL